jgi:solute carrier family 25 carnitine/acylcarnitine transporter 20/29
MPELDYAAPIQPFDERYLYPLETYGKFMNSSVSAFIPYASGALAGVSRAFVGQPFDTVKVKMQTHPEMYRSSAAALRCVLRTEGVKGLYRGVTAPLTGNAVISCIQFSVYNSQKEEYGAWLAGAAAGAAASLVTSPVEYLRIKMQLANKLDNNKKYRGVLDCARHIIAQDGFNPLRLFRGLGITIARESIGYAAFFGTYSMVKSPTGIKIIDDIIRGVACGVALWGSMYPLDVIKSRVQGALLETQHHGVVWHARDIYKSVGWRGFMKGFDIVMIRALPVNVAIVMTVEASKVYIK